MKNRICILLLCLLSLLALTPLDGFGQTVVIGGNTSIGGYSGSFSFTGSGVACNYTTLTCTFSSSGGSMTWPTFTGLAAYGGSNNWVTPTYAMTVALWASGSCTGLLKSDGTCVATTAFDAAGAASTAQSNAETYAQSVNTTGTAANVIATSNSTLTTLPSLSLPIGQVTGTINATQVNGAAVPSSAKAIGTNSSGQVISIDYPEALYIPAANCNNVTAGAAWSIGSSGTAACRGGTNNLGGYVAITDTSGTFAQFSVPIPQDWDSSSLPYIRFQLAYPGTDGGSSHTIIPQIKVACTNGTSGAADDPTLQTAHSSSTITLSSATANLYFSTSNMQLNSTDMTNCVAGSLMIIQVGRATDTATSAANFYGATLTIPRQIVMQAN